MMIFNPYLTPTWPTPGPWNNPLFWLIKAAIVRITDEMRQLELQGLINQRGNGEITEEQFLQELKNRGFI